MGWKKPKEELVKKLDEEMEGMGERGKMFGYPVYYLNGNMFMGLFEDRVFMRLSPQDKKEILAGQKEAEPFTPRSGRTMKEYATLPGAVLEDRDTFRSWRDRSYTFVSSLPPKVQKKGRRPNE